MGGIAEDIIAGALERFLAGGMGYSVHLTTTGTNTDTKVASDVNRILPALTIINQGSNSIKIGYQTALVSLAAGASYTFRWKNPARSKIVFNDGGNAATVDVIA